VTVSGPSNFASRMSGCCCSKSNSIRLRISLSHAPPGRLVPLDQVVLTFTTHVNLIHVTFAGGSYISDSQVKCFANDCAWDSQNNLTTSGGWGRTGRTDTKVIGLVKFFFCSSVFDYPVPSRVLLDFV
jgi:hypothetical protein